MTAGTGAAGAEVGAGPLAHLRVLDFTALVQGPLATQILGDLGADVVKVERTEGEWSRHWGILDGHTHGETDSFLAFNRNKRSVACDLKDKATRDGLLEMGQRVRRSRRKLPTGGNGPPWSRLRRFCRPKPRGHIRQLVGLRYKWTCTQLVRVRTC